MFWGRGNIYSKGGHNGDRLVKIRKLAGKDEIRPKMLKALNSKGIILYD